MPIPAGVGDGRTGHATEDQRYDHVHIRQGPTASTDEGFGEGEHGVGDFARVHHVGGEDEQWYGHEHIPGVQRSHRLSDNESDIASGVEQVVDACGQHAVGDGNVEQEGQHQHDDRNPQRQVHYCSPPGLFCFEREECLDGDQAVLDKVEDREGEECEKRCVYVADGDLEHRGGLDSHEADEVDARGRT